MGRKDFGVKQKLYLEYIIHPGESLRLILEDRKISQKDLAARTECTEVFISNLINGERKISASFAKKLEKVLGIRQQFWIGLEKNYDKEMEDFVNQENCNTF